MYKQPSEHILRSEIGESRQIPFKNVTDIANCPLYCSSF